MTRLRIIPSATAPYAADLPTLRTSDRQGGDLRTMVSATPTAGVPFAYEVGTQRFMFVRKERASICPVCAEPRDTPCSYAQCPNRRSA